MLLGDGAAADAKRRLLERAGAVIVGEDSTAALAVVAIDDEAEALAAVERLKSRGILVNAVDRPALCDFTVPAIVDRAPVLVAIGTGGVSAGLAAALRQRIEALLPARLGALAEALHASRGAMRTRFPDGGDRRRAIGVALSPGGALDPLVDQGDPDIMQSLITPATARIIKIGVRSADPEDLTLRETRLLALADRLFHTPDVPAAILDRARADADRIIGPPPSSPLPGLSIALEMMA